MEFMCAEGEDTSTIGPERFAADLIVSSARLLIGTGVSPLSNIWL